MLQNIPRESEEVVGGGSAWRRRRGGEAARGSEENRSRGTVKWEGGGGQMIGKEGVWKRERGRVGCWELRRMQPIAAETQLQAKSSWFTNQPLHLPLSPSYSLLHRLTRILKFRQRQTRDCVSMLVRWRGVCSDCVCVCLSLPLFACGFKLEPVRVCVCDCWVFIL